MKTKLVKPNNDMKLVIDMQYIIMSNTNSKLISLQIHHLCKKFVADLKKIPLSQELQ